MSWLTRMFRRGRKPARIEVVIVGDASKMEASIDRVLREMRDRKRRNGE